LVKYGKKAPSTFCILSEFVFYEQFMECFCDCGTSFMEQGKHFTAKKFCDLIHPNGSQQLRTVYRSLFNSAEQYFDFNCASVHLKRAFKQHSIQKVHRIYKTLFLSRFYNITSQLKDEFQSYLCLCGAELTQRNQSV